MLKYNSVFTNDDLKATAEFLNANSETLSIGEICGFATMKLELMELADKPFTAAFKSAITERIGLIENIDNIHNTNFENSGMQFVKGIDISGGVANEC